MQTLPSVIQAFFQKAMRFPDEYAREQAGLFRDDIIEGTPIDKGALRNAWQGPTKIGDAHYQMKNERDYATTVEFGGYPGVGPKTEKVGAFTLADGIQVNAGIYPTQRPAGMVRQALAKRKRALADISKVFVRVVK